LRALGNREGYACREVEGEEERKMVGKEEAEMKIEGNGKDHQESGSC
jgi:hypothetical protein